MDDFGNIDGYVIVSTYSLHLCFLFLICHVAVLVACVPAWASLLRRPNSSKKPLHGSRGYVKQTSSKERIHLGNMKTCSQRPESSERDILGVDGGSNHEEHFASNPRDITVTTTVQVSGGRSTQ